MDFFLSIAELQLVPHANPWGLSHKGVAYQASEAKTEERIPYECINNLEVHRTMCSYKLQFSYSLIVFVFSSVISRKMHNECHYSTSYIKVYKRYHSLGFWGKDGIILNQPQGTQWWACDKITLTFWEIEGIKSPPPHSLIKQPLMLLLSK